MTLIFTYKEPVTFSPEDGKPLPRKVHFAADYIANSGTRYESMLTPKYRTYGDGDKFLFSFCGDLRLGQLLAHTINGVDTGYELYSPRKNDLDFVVEDVVPKFQEALKEAGVSLHDPNTYANFDGLLITPSRQVFIIGADLSVCELENPLWVSGSGDGAARAVWDVLNDMSWDIFEGLETVEDRIYATFRYVSRNDPSVGEKVSYLLLEEQWNND